MSVPGYPPPIKRERLTAMDYRSSDDSFDASFQSVLDHSWCNISLGLDDTSDPFDPDTPRDAPTRAAAALRRRRATPTVLVQEGGRRPAGV